MLNGENALQIACMAIRIKLCKNKLLYMNLSTFKQIEFIGFW